MSAISDSLLGKTLDDYRLEKPLGAGGMAKVYRALDVRLKRYVAIKVIAHDFRANPEYRARFEREAQSIARLEHPNIVRIYRFGEVEGMYYMAMQYIEGADLTSLIYEYSSNGEVMPLDDVVRLVQDIGTALDFAHSHDVIHRDVKSGNIMVDQQGRAVLTDFGLALQGDIGTRGEILGSPHYISPEQAVSSANVVPQSDLYSLGVTLFEMLTGELPFTSDEVVELTMRHMSDSPPAPSTINPALPPSIDEVVLHALEKEPYDRYQTGAELSAALSTAVADWKSSQQPITEGRRPSLVLLPDKVREQMQAFPLPPIAPTPAQTRRAAANQTATMAAVPRSETSEHSAANRWRGALVFAMVVFLGGLVLILALRPASETASASQPTDVAAGMISPSPQSNSEVAPTEVASTLIPTLSPDTALTNAAIIAPTTIPVTVAIVPPTNTLVEPTAIPATPLPPTPEPPTPIVWYELLIARHRNDSLMVVNASSSAFPLAPLRLGDERSIDGSEWGVDVLMTNQCVVAIKDRGNARMPDVPCTEVGSRLMRGGRDRFWEDGFNVYYNGVLVTTCNRRDENCFVSIHG